LNSQAQAALGGVGQAANIASRRRENMPLETKNGTAWALIAPRRNIIILRPSSPFLRRLSGRATLVTVLRASKQVVSGDEDGIMP